MSDVLRNLLHVLKLEQIEVNLFRGQSQDLWVWTCVWRTSHRAGSFGS